MFSLPNLITAINLFLGCMACIELVEGHYEPALILLAGCLLADFLDGFVARMMGSDSSLGVQLDSLADVVSFGLAPGLMIFKLMESNGSTTQHNHFALFWFDPSCICCISFGPI
ncbi:MAG: CDP-alcohol phosphatidyltransferase family protein [Saprospiraceae bacterium]|nr:CDP-alcohol phosphatidyltransferase family protein [Candidatus Vicinibacter affinis]